MASIQKKDYYYLQVYNIIKEKILSGELKLGEKIVESKIAEELGVSRSPVREAIRALEKEELAVSSGGSIIVNPMDQEHIIDIYDCRIVLESYAARETALKITDEDIQKMQEFVFESRECYEKNDYAGVVEKNSAFHDMAVSYCTNQYLMKMIDQMKSLSLLLREREFYNYKRDVSVLYEHMEIVDAFREKDADLVEHRMRKHIEGDLDFYKKHSMT